MQQLQHRMFSSFIYRLFAIFFPSSIFIFACMICCGQVRYCLIQIAYEQIFYKRFTLSKRKRMGEINGDTHMHALLSRDHTVDGSIICCVRNIECELNGAQINHMSYLNAFQVPRNERKKKKRKKIYAAVVVVCLQNVSERRIKYNQQQVVVRWFSFQLHCRFSI